MVRPILAASAALMLLAGCKPAPDVPAPANEAVPAAVNEAEPGAAAHLPDTTPLPAGGMAEWLVGHWAFGDDCASDFTVQYNADGTVDNSGEMGTWKLDNDKITETITEKFEMGDEAPQKVEPAKVRSFPVERIDHNHGRITSPFNGNKVPILRC